MTMTPEITTAWWNSRQVVEARRRAEYDSGDGDLRDVLVALLAVVDEDEEADAGLPPIPQGRAYELAAADYDRDGRVRGERRGALYANGAITQLLDLGADVARLREVFDPETVDKVVAKWASWREVVVTAARRGATSDEIRALVPPKIAWNPQIRTVLETHGLVLPDPLDRRYTAGARQKAVIELRAAGHTIGAIAANVGCSRQNVTNILRSHREGRLQVA
jgi:hypothetical protein